MADPVSIVMGVTQTLVSVIQPLIQRVLEVRSQRQQLNQNLDRHIGDMESKLRTMTTVLKGVDEHVKTPGVQEWLQQLKEVLYDADDLIDEYLTDASIQVMVSSDQGTRSSCNELMTTAAKKPRRTKVRSKFACCFTNYHGVDISNSAIKLSEMVNSVMIINERLHSLGRIRLELGLKPTSDSDITSPQSSVKFRHTTSTLDMESPTEGRESDKKEIVKTLLKKIGKQTASTFECNTSNNRSILVLAIYGMGGIGKTTLARLVFNDLEVKSNFDLLAWVCVSCDFDVPIVTRKLIESIYFFQGKGKAPEWTTLQVLQNELQQLLEGKTFLLILDDVWNGDDELWESLLKPLNAVQTGNSCVITTTRDISIANKVTRCTNPINLQALEDDDIWKILHRNAFEINNKMPEDYEKLECIGKKIIEKLKGSPLAAKSIGRLLGSDHSVEHWLKILRSELWELEQDEYSILPILMISYHHLPSNLKKCLLCFSLYPKNYQFSGDDIIHIWMGQNVIQSVRGERIEDIGQKYLRTLVDRSFLQYDSVKYSMHDLIHDVLISICQYDFYCVYQENKIETYKRNPTISLRHVSVFNKDHNSLIRKICDDGTRFTKLRTLMFMNIAGFHFDVVHLEHLIEKTRHLRVLAISGCSILSLPESIAKLKHLRVIDLSSSIIRELPYSLGNLHNLQVLDLDGCNDLCRLPSSVTKLVNLRHLIVDVKKLSHIKQIGRLSMLQRLDLFSISNEIGMHIDELKDMNTLHKSLEIRNVQFVRTKEEAQQAQLDKKEYLEELRYGWAMTADPVAGSEENVWHTRLVEEEVFEALQPCYNLKRICIDGYKGFRLPTWLNNSWLSWLEKVELVNCDEMYALPPCLGKMQFLKWLSLHNMCNLKRIKCERTSNEKNYDDAWFPALETLILHDLPDLVEWRVDDRIQEEGEIMLNSVVSLIRLEKLSIARCPKLEDVAIPVLVSLKTLKVTTTTYAAWKTLTFDGDFRVFTSLEKLVLGPCSNDCLANDAASRVKREEWAMGGSESVGLLPPSLSELKMKSCDQMALSGFSFSELNSLRWLEITEYYNIRFLHLPDVTYLERIYIAGCPNLVYFHLPSSLVALGNLTICYCDQLESLQLSSAFSAEVFQIVGCPKLIMTVSPHCSCEFANLSFWKLLNPSIQEATKAKREQGELLPLLNIKHLIVSGSRRHYLTRILRQIIPDRLLFLDISRCSDLEHIDDDGDGLGSAFLSFTSLKRLGIQEFEHLKSLPLDMIYRLPSLDTICLNDCPLLSLLPDKENLASLQHFDFGGCPMLEGVYQKQR